MVQVITSKKIHRKGLRLCNLWGYNTLLLASYKGATYNTLLLASYKGELELFKGNLALPWEWYSSLLSTLSHS